MRDFEELFLFLEDLRDEIQKKCFVPLFLFLEKNGKILKKNMREPELKDSCTSNYPAVTGGMSGELIELKALFDWQKNQEIEISKWATKWSFRFL